MMEKKRVGKMMMMRGAPKAKLRLARKRVPKMLRMIMTTMVRRIRPCLLGRRILMILMSDD